MSQNMRIWVGLAVWSVFATVIWHWAIFRGATEELIGGMLTGLSVVLIVVCYRRYQRGHRFFGKRRRKRDSETGRKPWNSDRPE